MVNEDYARVLKTVDEMQDEIVGFAQELFRVPSITKTPAEKEAVEVCARKMREVGLKVTLCGMPGDFPNAIGKLKDEKGGLGFNSHIDAVPVEPISAWKYDPFGAEIHDGKIWARASADCKGGEVCAIMAMKVLKEAGIKLKGNVQIAAVVDEELGGKRGMGYVVDQKNVYTPNISIQGDPANGLDTYTAAHKSPAEIEITTKGKQFHAGAAHKGGINAIQKMCKIILAVNDQFKSRLPPAHHKLYPEGATIAAGTTIQGGIDQWMVPDACTATFISGVIPYQNTEQHVYDALVAIINDLKKDDPQIDATVKIKHWKTGDDVPDDAPVAMLVKKSAQEAIGITPHAYGVPFCGMSSYLSNVAKIPTVIYGCGSTVWNGTHAPNEWIAVDDLFKYTKTYCFAAMNYLGYTT